MLARFLNAKPIVSPSNEASAKGKHNASPSVESCCPEPVMPMKQSEWLQAPCDRFVNQGFFGNDESSAGVAAGVLGRSSTLSPNCGLSAAAFPTATIASGAASSNSLAA